jgi:hypothetical protein
MSEYRTTAREIPDCDVAVAGAGMAGVMAALAAADAGAETVLIEQHAFVGGQATAGGVHTFCGETRLVNDRWREMLGRLKHLGGLADYRPNDDGRAFDSEALKFVLQEMLAAAGVRLLLHTHLVDVEREGEEARALILFNKSGPQRLACRQVVDATGDADVIARGGWPFLKGGPAFKPGDELELDTTGPKQLPMSLYFTLVDVGEAVEPVLPPGCPAFDGDEDLPMVTVIPHDRRISVKMKVIGFDAADGESLSEAEQAARRQMMGAVYHLQTRGYRGRTYPTYKLAWVFPHIGIREGRRVVAQYILKAEDCLKGRHFPDAIAVGSYHADYHWPNVLQRAGTGVTTQYPPYQIPFRAMRPVEAANVLVPGRCLSGEQMAMSSFRVMGICAQTGFAAGAAAALALRQDRALDELDRRDLRRVLRDAGLRLDLAPYGNYLRRRRAVEEAVAAPAERVTDVALAPMPDGSIVAAWREATGALRVAVRWEEEWSPAEVVSPTSPPGGLELRADVSSRLGAEGIEEACLVVEESDDAPAILLYCGSAGFLSRDGGRSWSAGSADRPGVPAPDPIRLVPSPGDPPRVAKWIGDALEVSASGAAEGAVRLPLDVNPAGPRPALVATSEGLVSFFADAEGRVVFRRIPTDQLAGEAEKGGNWRHEERTWLDLLAGHREQPMREG